LQRRVLSAASLIGFANVGQSTRRRKNRHRPHSAELDLPGRARRIADQSPGFDRVRSKLYGLTYANSGSTSHLPGDFVFAWPCGDRGARWDCAGEDWMLRPGGEERGAEGLRSAFAEIE
jgi:hypothetical protein